MEVAIGQAVLAPDPNGGNGMVRATVVEYGAQDDAVDVMIEGKLVRRDVAILRYEEGLQEGFTGRCRYDLLRPTDDA